MGQAKRKRQTDERPLALVSPKGPKRISVTDGAYLKKVRAGLQQAAQLEQQAAQLRQQAAQLEQQAVALLGAHESWVDHLCEVYRVTKETDDIDHDTLLITRAPALDIVAPPEEPPAAPPTSLRTPRVRAQGKASPGAETDAEVPPEDPAIE